MSRGSSLTPVPNSLGIEDLPELAPLVTDHPDRPAGRGDTDADVRSIVRTTCPDRGAVRDVAFNLLLVGLGFAGGVILPNEKPSAAELHWMEQAARRLAAVDAMTASSERVSKKFDPERAAFRPSILPLPSSGPYRASR